MKLNYFPDTDSLYIDLATSQASRAGKFPKASFWITMIKATWAGSTSITPAGHSIYENLSRNTFL